MAKAALDDSKQKLWLLVPTRLAAVQARGTRLRRSKSSTATILLRAPNCCLLSPSFLVPCLTHNGIKIWDTLAIAEYLNEILPTAGLLPKTLGAPCPVPCNQRRDAFWLFEFTIRAADESESTSSWISRSGPVRRPISTASSASGANASPTDKGPFLFGATACMADAMFAPVVTRFLSYDVKLDSDCTAYCATVMALPADARMGRRGESRAGRSRRTGCRILIGRIVIPA